MSSIQKCPQCGYKHQANSQDSEDGILVCVRCQHKWAKSTHFIGNYKYTKKIDTQALFNCKKGAANKVPSNMLIARLKEKKANNIHKFPKIDRDKLEKLPPLGSKIFIKKETPKITPIMSHTAENKSSLLAPARPITDVDKIKDREHSHIAKEDLGFNQEKADYLKNKQFPIEKHDTIPSAKTANIERLEKDQLEDLNKQDIPSYERHYTPNSKNPNNNINRQDVNIKKTDKNKAYLDAIQQKSLNNKIFINKESAVSEVNKDKITAFIKERNLEVKKDEDSQEFAYHSKDLKHKEHLISKGEGSVRKAVSTDKITDAALRISKIDMPTRYDKSEFANKEDIVAQAKKKISDYKEVISAVEQEKIVNQVREKAEKFTDISKLNINKDSINSRADNGSHPFPHPMQAPQGNFREQATHNQRSVPGQSNNQNINKRPYSDFIKEIKPQSNNLVPKVFITKEELANKKKTLKPFEVTTASNINDLRKKVNNVISENTNFGVISSNNIRKNIPLTAAYKSKRESNNHNNTSHDIRNTDKTSKFKEDINTLSRRIEIRSNKKNIYDFEQKNNGNIQYNQDLHQIISHKTEHMVSALTTKNVNSLGENLIFENADVNRSNKEKRENKNNIFQFLDIKSHQHREKKVNQSIGSNLSNFCAKIWQNIFLHIKSYVILPATTYEKEKNNNAQLFLGVLHFPKGFFSYVVKDKKRLKQGIIYCSVLILVILGFAFENKITRKLSKQQGERMMVDNYANTSFSKEQLKNGKYITPNSIDGNLPLLLEDKKNQEYLTQKKIDIKVAEEKEAFALSREEFLTPEVIKEELSRVEQIDQYKQQYKEKANKRYALLSKFITTYKLKWQHFIHNIFNNVKISDTYNSWVTQSGKGILDTQVVLANSSNKTRYLIRSLRVTFLDLDGGVIGSRVIVVNKSLSPQERSNLLLKIPDTPIGTLTSRVFIHEQVEE